VSLGDIIGNMDLTTFPKVALVIFMGVFAAVTFRAITLGRRLDIDRAARLALEEDEREGPCGLEQGPETRDQGSGPGSPVPEPCTGPGIPRGGDES